MRLVILLLQLSALLSTSFAELLLASVLFRHGHRNIMRAYKFDPYSNESYWPGGIGEMTNRGNMQMYQFGQLLRERYGGVINWQYHPEHVLVRSSANTRCVRSALCVVAGLFPPTGDEVWNPNLLWQPIPVFADRKLTSNLLQGYMDCPAYKEEFENQMKSPEVQAFNANYSDVYRIISEHWKSVHVFDLPNNLHDHFKIEEDRGFTLPNWTESIYPEKLKEISIMYQVFRTRTPLMLRLKMGPLVKDIVDCMREKKAGTERRRRKLLLYSGHDDNITGMLAALGQPNKFIVQYGAAIFFELHSTSPSDYKVKIYFMPNADDKQIQEVIVPGCGASCELDAFAELMSPMMPDNWDAECQINNNASESQT